MPLNVKKYGCLYSSSEVARLAGSLTPIFAPEYGVKIGNRKFFTHQDAKRITMFNLPDRCNGQSFTPSVRLRRMFNVSDRFPSYYHAQHGLGVVFGGMVFYSESDLDKIKEMMLNKPNSKTAYKKRHKRIKKMLEQGKNVKQIAHKMGLHQSTVYNHRRKVENEKNEQSKEQSNSELAVSMVRGDESFHTS